MEQTADQLAAWLRAEDMRRLDNSPVGYLEYYENQYGETFMVEYIGNDIFNVTYGTP